MTDLETNAPPVLKVAVLGAGAMGSLFGGWLAEGGSDVCLVDINQAHLDAVERDGLRLTTDQGERRIQLRVGRPGDNLGSPDVVLIFTKTMHTRAALAASQNLIMAGATLVSMQKGSAILKSSANSHLRSV